MLGHTNPFIIYFPVRVSHSWVGCFHGFGPKAELGEWATCKSQLPRVECDCSRQGDR